MATNNSIEEIIVSEPNGSNCLQYLNLSSNSLTSISSFVLFGKLIELDISYNLLHQINAGVFEMNPNLEKINLRGNLLKIFDFNALPNVNYLDLSYNNLEVIKMYGDLLALYELHVEGNNLTSINTNMKYTAPNLERLGINDNVFECDQLKNDLMFLRIDNIKVIEHTSSDMVMRTNYSSNVNGISCYKQNGDLVERVEKLEQQVNKLLTNLFSPVTTDLPVLEQLELN